MNFSFCAYKKKHLLFNEKESTLKKMSSVLGSVPLLGSMMPSKAVGYSAAATVVATFVLFALLSPGYLLSLPLNSKEHCASLIPYPTQSIPADCDEASPTEAIQPICDARAKCQGFGHKAMGYTNVVAPWLHAFLFVLLLALVLSLVKLALSYLPPSVAAVVPMTA